MALSADGRRLYVADYGLVLFVIDLRTSRFWLTKPLTDQSRPGQARPGIDLRGIDGLCRVGNRLVAVQNGMGHNRVVALRPDVSGHSIEHLQVLENRAVVLPEPTLGTRVGSWFYFVANSSWSCYTSNGSLLFANRPSRPVYIRRNRL